MKRVYYVTEKIFYCDVSERNILYDFWLHHLIAV